MPAREVRVLQTMLHRRTAVKGFVSNPWAQPLSVWAPARVRTGSQGLRQHRPIPKCIAKPQYRQQRNNCLWLMCHRECKSVSFKRRKIQLMICYFPSNESAVPLPYHWLHQPLFYLIMPLKWLYLLCSLWSTSPWSAPVLQPGQSVWPPTPYPSVTHTQKTLPKLRVIHVRGHEFSA